MEPTFEPSDRRVLDFEATGRELGALRGSRVGVELSHLAGSGPILTLIGRLDSVWPLGLSPQRSLAIAVGEGSMRVAESRFARAIHESYEDERASLRWSLVAIELRIGVLIEIEEVPAGSRDRERCRRGYRCS